MFKSRTVKSPVFPTGHTWAAEKRQGGYESDVSAMIRTMQQDERIAADQRFAFERWRKEDASAASPVK